MIQEVFNRVEKKYLLSKQKAEQLMKQISKYVKAGEYPYTQICNIYFDTENKELIRKSIEKPVYKEKVRIRSYGIPNKKDKIYLEIKKKFNGVVTKRRIGMTLKEMYDYLEKGIIPESKKNKQIFKEVDYCFKRYNLNPTMYIYYERYSYVGKIDQNFRLTFDTNITYRDYDLKLEKGNYGNKLIDDRFYLMEVKCLGSMPLWLTKALADLKIYPTSFSKYGKIYKNDIKNNKFLKIS